MRRFPLAPTLSVVAACFALAPLCSGPVGADILPPPPPLFFAVYCESDPAGVPGDTIAVRFRMDVPQQKEIAVAVSDARGWVAPQSFSMTLSAGFHSLAFVAVIPPTATAVDTDYVTFIAYPVAAPADADTARCAVRVQFLSTAVPLSGRCAVRLGPPAPNPSGTRQSVTIELARPARVSLEVLDVHGRLVRRLISGRELPPGRHEQAWDLRAEDGAAVGAGVFFYRLRAGAVEAKRATVILR